MQAVPVLMIQWQGMLILRGSKQQYFAFWGISPALLQNGYKIC